MMTPHPPARSFADREIARQGHLVHKLKARDSTGEWAYYFVLVQPQKERLFMERIGGDGMIDLEAYGRVIASNYGEEPSPQTRQLLKERFGWEV
jgi:hypothetical protein